MSIEGVKANAITKTVTTMWKDIFEKQKNYRAGFPDLKNFNIDNFKSQFYLKSYHWQITEEIIKALEALYNKQWNFYIENLIDAAIYLVELSLLLNLKAKSILSFTPLLISVTKIKNIIDRSARFEFGCIYFLGLAGNCLRSKYEETDCRMGENNFKFTNEKDYKDCIIASFSCLIKTLNSIGFDDERIWQSYIRRDEYNDFYIKRNNFAKLLDLL